ncbi:hypothetical protein [Microbulbifer sp. GL-2]|uniref:hypothetical protein n=1 Tax=Microbulbifer sp. GL-2 TaxID=2591606 RepID=UPI00116270BF|nr:hypothetical protein [Microbulbifer sp. GL-2]BBM04190.1 hypothetical protein GL2_42640 [Microbulbifer sp. GL-2]
MNQRGLRLYQTVTEYQVYNAWLNNAQVHAACSWPEVVRDQLLFGCLYREAAYTHRGQSPQQFSKYNNEEIAMPAKEVCVLDLAEVRQIKLALALCRERIACPETTTVNRQEAVRELRAAQDIFVAHEDRVSDIRKLNSELGGAAHG